MSKVIAITGCMFSGKSVEFIRKVNGLRAAGLKVSVFKPAIDIRDGFVKSRDGSTLNFTIIPQDDGKPTYPTQVYLLMGQNNPHWIAIDEAQFVDSAAMHTVMCYLPNTNFLICGLNKDYLNRPFGFMAKALTLADDIIVLKATCSICKRTDSATRTIKISGDTSGNVEIGSDQYQAACTFCYKEFMGKMGST